MIRYFHPVFQSLTLSVALMSCNGPEPSQRPNIILILADDMGYSDLGCTGSEIATPNLDRLAANGALFTHCYNASRCCPTRASLLTGLYQHRTGVGHMNSDFGYPAYQGYLNDQCVTIAEVLKDKGYHTYMSGKWHVGDERDHWPDRRGFGQFYGIPKGGGLYFYPSEFIDRPIFRNGEQVYPDPATFYSTNNFTDEAIQFIKGQKDEKPFFLYLAYIAPHFPLQALPGDIEKYENTYKAGYEAIRQSRYKKQLELGIIDSDTKLSPSDYPSWDSISNKDEEARKMAVYAAQIDRLDQNIGKLVQSLREMGKLDNTVLFFLSDNGATAEEINRSPGQEIGSPDSFVSYGANWANVSNTPYRLYKSREHEGGIMTPMIMHWPAGIRKPGQLIDQPVHIIDFMPTCLALANAAYPEQFNGTAVHPTDGMNFLPLLKKQENLGPRQLFWEHQGNKAVRWGDWKLVKQNREPWELYQLNDDHSELNNIADLHSGLVDSLETQWKSWAKEVGVRKWPIEN